jgi:hypothetical protein
MRRNGTLPLARVKLLDAIAFEWEPFDNAWNKQLLAAIDLFKEGGNGGLHQSKAAEYGTNRWLKLQRDAEQAGKLSEARSKKLQAAALA